ncbi:MAG: hypothetical protein V1827_06210 [Candidatus Micrarchaeota archaeon]
MKTGFALLVLCTLLSAAAFEQTYVQTVSPDGSSDIIKSAELTVVAIPLAPGSFERMAEICQGSGGRCSVDPETRMIVLSESFEPGTYYTYSTEYGILMTTHTLTVNSIPTDRFGKALDDLFLEAEAITEVGGPVRPIVLSEKARNKEGSDAIRSFGANLTYVVNMPGGVIEAHAGDMEAAIDGRSATFDLLEVMGDSEPLIIKSSEINLTYIVLFCGILVIGYLAYTFLKPQPAKKKKK